METESFLQIGIILNVLLGSFRFICIPICYRSTTIIIISLSAWAVYSLYTSESDVYRRQIMLSKDGPHAERVNPQC